MDGGMRSVQNTSSSIVFRIHSMMIFFFLFVSSAALSFSVQYVDNVDKDQGQPHSKRGFISVWFRDDDK